MSQFFPSDEFINAIVKIGASTIRLPSGSSLLVGGLFYRNLSDLDMDISTAGAGGLDIGVVANSTIYYMYVVDVAGVLSLVSSLSASAPTGFDSYRRIGKIDTDGVAEVSVVNADAINDVQQSEIESLQLQQSTNTSDIFTLQSTSGSAGTDITNLQSDVGTLQTDVGNLQTDMSTAQTDIGNLQTQQGTNTTNIGTNTTNIGTNTTDVGTLQTDVGNLGTATTNNATNIGTNTGNIGTNTGNVNNLLSEFNTTTGHRHDGLDARRILGTDIDITGGLDGEVLTVDNLGNAVWEPIPAIASQQSSETIGWIDGQPSSPTLQIYTNGSLTAHRYYPFAQGSNQKLYGTVKVPQSHEAGKVIRLSVSAYTANVNAALFYKFDCTTYLVQAGDTGTNLSKISTLGITNAGTTLADEQETILFNLTDGAGQISGNTVSAGDVLHITLERATLVADDIVDTVKLLGDVSEVTFNSI